MSCSLAIIPYFAVKCTLCSSAWWPCSPNSRIGRDMVEISYIHYTLLVYTWATVHASIATVTAALIRTLFAALLSSSLRTLAAQNSLRLHCTRTYTDDVRRMGYTSFFFLSIFSCVWLRSVALRAAALQSPLSILY